ncbi:MAG: hypothetical protein CBC65_001705 [Rhodothermaceae bacterium TMED105]|nr:MAG: hypothetical protein CBC65_001705 [Rhodothermaceae bacterium TMED105]
MIIERAFVAACASCFTTLALYPLDTAKTAQQLGKPPPPLTRHTYAGSIPDALGTFAATGTYFLTYEHSLSTLTGVYRVPISSFIGISIAGLVITPTDVVKRRAQVTRNRIDNLYRFSFKSLSRTYTLGLLKNAPKTVLKYAIYEILLNILRQYLQLDIAGALSAMIATLGTTTLFTPLDVLKTYVSLGKPLGNRTSVMYRGLLLSLIQSIVGNGLGHFILERFAPRS